MHQQSPLGELLLFPHDEDDDDKDDEDDSDKERQPSSICTFPCRQRDSTLGPAFQPPTTL